MIINNEVRLVWIGELAEWLRRKYYTCLQPSTWQVRTGSWSDNSTCIRISPIAFLFPFWVLGFGWFPEVLLRKRGKVSRKRVLGLKIPFSRFDVGIHSCQSLLINLLKANIWLAGFGVWWYISILSSNIAVGITSYGKWHGHFHRYSKK